jgi:hypothetical protein
MLWPNFSLIAPFAQKLLQGRYVLRVIYGELVADVAYT